MGRFRSQVRGAAARIVLEGRSGPGPRGGGGANEDGPSSAPRPRPRPICPRPPPAHAHLSPSPRVGRRRAQARRGRGRSKVRKRGACDGENRAAPRQDPALRIRRRRRRRLSFQDGCSRGGALARFRFRCAGLWGGRSRRPGGRRPRLPVPASPGSCAGARRAVSACAQADNSAGRGPRWWWGERRARWKAASWLRPPPCGLADLTPRSLGMTPTALRPACGKPSRPPRPAVSSPRAAEGPALAFSVHCEAMGRSAVKMTEFPAGPEWGPAHSPGRTARVPPAGRAGPRGSDPGARRSSGPAPGSVWGLLRAPGTLISCGPAVATPRAEFRPGGRSGGASSCPWVRPWEPGRPPPPHPGSCHPYAGRPSCPEGGQFCPGGRPGPG
ncbi:translation initiation factor IF-2 [Oryctolagus cuniculus]|uniref:translation initiation factor IF-2 n=1 Tax=Oryctolagus cuniculus TaxID=9986 RepID=UPI00387A5680